MLPVMANGCCRGFGRLLVEKIRIRVISSFSTSRTAQKPSQVDRPGGGA
jgi:hypothetical protein